MTFEFWFGFIGILFFLLLLDLSMAKSFYKKWISKKKGVQFFTRWQAATIKKWVWIWIILLFGNLAIYISLIFTINFPVVFMILLGYTYLVGAIYFIVKYQIKDRHDKADDREETEKQAKAIENKVEETNPKEDE